MASLLYAEIYLICLIVTSLLLWWTSRGDALSASGRWLRGLIIAFLCNFASNFLFTLFNGVRISEALALPASYLFKSLYHITLCVGVFTWCGYAETEMRSRVFDQKGIIRLSAVLAVPIVLIVLNLWTKWLFEITPDTLYYRRNFLFQLEMAALSGVSATCGFRLLKKSQLESDPAKLAHMRLTATFPLCIMAAWILSFIGEAVPVICVSVMVELLCLYMGTTLQQISLDKLTQVNNRQNLMSFMDYKLRSHEEELYLLLIDVDYFKSINDTFGHLEGDNALIIVARALKLACGSFRRRPYIARYGGDEFIIVLEGSDGDAEELKSEIKANLRELSDDRPYKLRVSIGTARREPGMDHRALIAAADGALYEIKKARH